MRTLFVGGTGLIGSAAATVAEAAGHEVWIVSRGRSPLGSPNPDRHITADATDSGALKEALRGRHFDVVVQWVGFTPDHVRDDTDTFAEAGHYLFISSASVYEKPPSSWLVSEATPTVNPYWAYSQQKIECEQVLQAARTTGGFPATIVRPSLTYGDSQIPVAIGSWSRPFTLVDRMRRGAPILVPGDGTSIWTITHTSDFARGLVGLFGLPAAVGGAVNITSDEALSWNQVYGQLGAAAGVTPDLVHVPTDGLVAADPSLEGTLVGDKIHSTVFDNTKLRTLVPGFASQVPFAEGIARTVAWFDADPARQAIDDAANSLWDRVAEVYLDALRRVGRAP